MRSVFMGSPDFALPALRVLAHLTEVAGVVTQPDRPSGRGRRLTPPPVKNLADELELPCIQPEKLRQPDAMRQLLEWKPDVIVVAAFGQILRKEVLDLPPHGCVNLHASLLPRHRGASPVSAAILAGDPQTGITLMQMEAGLDTGPILAQMDLMLAPDDTTLSLTEKLARLAAETLRAYLPVYLQGGLVPQPQDEASATYAPQLRKEDGRLDFQRPAEYLARQVRACFPWPGAFLDWKGAPLKLIEADAVSQLTAIHPGTCYLQEGDPVVSCQSGALRLIAVQPAGKRAMKIGEFLRGATGFIGTQF